MEKERLGKLWEELLKQQPTNDDLRYIIEHVDSLGKAAGQKLMEQQPTNNDLRYIIEHVDSLGKAAGKLLKWSKKEIMEEIKRLG